MLTQSGRTRQLIPSRPIPSRPTTPLLTGRASNCGFLLQDPRLAAELDAAHTALCHSAQLRSKPPFTHALVADHAYGYAAPLQLSAVISSQLSPHNRTVCDEWCDGGRDDKADDGRGAEQSSSERVALPTANPRIQPSFTGTTYAALPFT